MGNKHLIRSKLAICKGRKEQQRDEKKDGQ
jgi:hypothetical protein